MKSLHHIFIKFRNWEYWPSYITNIPVVVFWLWHALKTRKLFFFSNINPGTATSGMLGNSKMGILDAIPTEYLPQSYLSVKGKSVEARKIEIKSFMNLAGIDYPIILKPDIGERGLKVARIDKAEELEKYLGEANYDAIVQEYVDLPLEATVFVYQIPDSTEKGITSVCVKEFLFIKGDGKQSIHELLEKHERGQLYEDVLESAWANKWHRVPGLNEIVFLQPIGNHSKGTKFINANHMIDLKMVETFSKILRQMNGFNYGRFDLKCANWDELKAGIGIKILEFNGVNSEPVHVYDPNYGILNRYIDFYEHWSLMAKIHRAQMKKGIEPLNFREAWRHLIDYRTYLKLVK